MHVFNVCDYGARGDGRTLDTAAIQRAIDEASAGATAGSTSRVLLPGGRKYLVGTIWLKSRIDFHLADDAEILISLNRSDYDGDAAVSARGAQDLTISGTGTINGRSPEILTHFDEKDEWWYPFPEWRPQLVVLTGCRNLQVSNVTLRNAPFWTMHMIGCDRVLVHDVKVRNQLDVPNCDGIVPDHSRNVEIKDCDVVCGDDGIVVKATAPNAHFGGSSNIVIRDCTIHTQDSGVKIGTETTEDIHDVLVERCEIRSCCRGLNIQLRDSGSIYNITFRNIRLTSRYHSDPWWGRGEAISFTAIPRLAGGAIGTIHDVLVENVKAIAENSARIYGSPASRPRNITFRNVDLTLDRWTKYRGGVYDNRPTQSENEVIDHPTCGFSVERADSVTLEDCSLTWGKNRPQYFGSAIETRDVATFVSRNFKGTAAFPEKQQSLLNH
jgi:hypothetical protein